jgi:hypothetical protein
MLFDADAVAHCAVMESVFAIVVLNVVFSIVTN